MVVGGEAGGLELVRRLGRKFLKRDDVRITLVDRNHSLIWKLLVHQVAAGTLNSSDDELSYLAQSHWHHFHLRLGALEAPDQRARTITIAGSNDERGEQYIPERALS